MDFIAVYDHGYEFRFSATSWKKAFRIAMKRETFANQLVSITRIA